MGVMALWMLVACGGGLTVEVPPSPAFGVVEVAATGRGYERIVLLLDGEVVAGDATERVTWAWDTSLSPAGDHVVTALGYRGSKDPAEVWAAVTVDPLAGDVEAPTIGFISPLDGDRKDPGEDVFVVLDPKDDVGLADVRLLEGDVVVAVLPPEGPWEVLWTPPGTGAWTLCGQATDVVGNAAESCVTFDVAGPGITECPITKPSGTEPVPVWGEVEVKVAVAGSASQTEFFADGSSIGIDTSDPYSVFWDAGTTPREVLLEAVVQAVDGGDCTAALLVSVEEPVVEAFTVKITQPSDGVTVFGTVPVKAGVEAGGVADTMTLFADDVFVAELPNDPWQFTWSSLGTPNGAEVELKVVAVEEKTGAVDEDTVTVVVKN